MMRPLQFTGRGLNRPKLQRNKSACRSPYEKIPFNLPGCPACRVQHLRIARKCKLIYIINYLNILFQKKLWRVNVSIYKRWFVITGLTVLSLLNIAGCGNNTGTAGLPAVTAAPSARNASKSVFLETATAVSPDLTGNGFSVLTSSSGVTTAFNLSATINTGSSDAGKAGSLFIVANLGSQWFFLDSGNRWVVYDGNATPPYRTGVLPAETKVTFLNGHDVMAYLFLNLYAGYGATFDEMVAAKRFKQFFTIPYVTVANNPPVARAGSDRTVTVKTVVTLDGSFSSDIDGDWLSYSWSLTSKPSESSAAISGSTAAKPSFTPDIAGSYVFSLVVNDGKINSTPASVTVTALAQEVISVSSSGTVAASSGVLDLPRRLPLFRKPFRGDYLNSAPFDHDLPLSFDGGGNNDYILTWWGGRIRGIWNGHSGHDWLLPVGTPVFAVADGDVLYAEAEPPFQCEDRGMVSALIVVIKHTAPDGEVFDTLYAHLDRIDVRKGDRLTAGQQLGVSGMTGCTNGPHLHFETVRRSDTNNGGLVSIDPFGWSADYPDPWEKNSEGARSVWLWKDGEAPDDGRRIEEVWGPGILE